MRQLVPLAVVAFTSISVAAEAQAPSALPVKSVTMFTSGVSYVERGGSVDGDAKVALTFRTGQINDILKSMIQLDERGRVQPATYNSRDPLFRTLQAFSVDLSRQQSLAELLNRLRGARVTVTAPKREITGQIVGVETRQVAGDDSKPLTASFLNLLAETGLASVRLDPDATIRFLDERIQSEFKEALGLLATSMDEQRRQVTLHFAGQGRRQVRVGYVTESPLWKMTYRLMIGGTDRARAAAKPYLQGWALVENTSDDDWNGIKLSLVSGRPVSFIQDLYQPLYLPRPLVPNDVVASPFPQTHGGNLQEERKVADAGAPGPAGPAATRAMGRMGGGLGGGGFGGGLGGGRGGFRREAGEMAKGVEDMAGLSVDNAVLLRDSVRAAAEGSRAGELFQYNITTPVTLPRQQAAMIPVVAEDIAGDKLLLWNPDSGSKYPLNAFRVRNTTGLHLKGGPITVFDEGAYAGDAKMEDIPPGDNRLISYAVELSVEGERQAVKSGATTLSISIKRGVLHVQRRQRDEITYLLKSRSGKARSVLVEHPFNAEFKLVQPAAAAERTAEVYRFAVALPAGKTETLKVVTERPISEQFAIFDFDINSLAFYATRTEATPKIREALQDIVQRRRKFQELLGQAAKIDADIKAINDDQERIRKNMAALDHNSALYKRYVTELDAQETRIQSLRKEAERLRQQSTDAQRELKAYLDGLTLEG